MDVKSVETLGSKIRFSSVLDIFFSLPPETMLIFSNYWMRLSRIWRILQIKEGVIHRGRRPRWITLSEICRILHILRKPNSIIALLFIQNIYSFLRSFAISLFVFLLTLSPGFRGQRFNNLQRAALLTSLAFPKFIRELGRVRASFKF